MKSRKERRAEARENGVAFEPQYNGRVVTKAEYDREVAELKEQRKAQKEKLKVAKTTKEEVKG